MVTRYRIVEIPKDQYQGRYIVEREGWFWWSTLHHGGDEGCERRFCSVEEAEEFIGGLSTEKDAARRVVKEVIA